DEVLRSFRRRRGREGAGGGDLHEEGLRQGRAATRRRHERGDGVRLLGRRRGRGRRNHRAQEGLRRGSREEDRPRERPGPHERVAGDTQMAPVQAGMHREGWGIDGMSTLNPICGRPDCGVSVIHSHAASGGVYVTDKKSAAYCGESQSVKDDPIERIPQINATLAKIPTTDQHKRKIRLLWKSCIIAACAILVIVGGLVLCLFLKGYDSKKIVEVSTTVFQVLVLSYGMGFFVPCLMTSILNMWLGIEMSRVGLELG